jgi:acetyltransferase
VTNGGGAGVLATDALTVGGGRLAELAPDTIAQLERVLPPTWSHGNPIDIIGDASGARYAAALEGVFADPGTDAFLVLNCPTALALPEEAACAVIHTITKRHAALVGRNVFTAWLGEHSAAAARQRFAEAHIPTYETPEAAVAGFLHRVLYQRNQTQLMETPPVRPDPFEPDVVPARSAVAGAIAAGKGWLDPSQVRSVLAAYRIALPAEANAADPGRAATAAASIGFPVVLKIRSPEITHKSDVGGVALALADAAAVQEAAMAMLARVKAARPEAKIDGFLVQRMVRRPDSVELLAGFNADPVFGPAIVFGQGGTAVEVVRDTAIGLPPLNALLARDQMARTRVWRLLQGYRGRPAAAIDAIAEVLIRLGQIAADLPEIRELDINPLIADAEGVVALDARIRVAPAMQPGAARLAIAPYPAELAGRERLHDGTAVDLRPIRPEDEPLLHDLVAHMSPEDLRLRFFTPIRSLSHRFAARLTQIDYDREMALLALDNRTVLGIARFFADPDREKAEYAVAVRTDWHGRGVGHLLMNHLIEVARQWGIGELVGDVLAENVPMLAMCRELGFATRPDPADPSIIRVGKRLNHP